ncbi:DMT family transporter [Verrucomicrobiales bacterium]|jgi:drug/metabolite transporter (DMT)-like permease|nr:DMT family transporter [Verrucomicrobiales bacterium]
MFSAGDLYAIGAGFFWSLSVILMRISGLTIPPLPLTLFRSFVAIVGFVVVLLFTDDSLLPKYDAMTWLRLVASAILGISIADTLFAAALNRLGASLQALADCIYAPSVAVVGFFLFGEGLTAWELIGGALVISGVFVGMVKTKEIDDPRDLIVGTVLAAGAHVIMALGILMVRDVIREGSMIWIAAFRFIVATAGLALFALARGKVDDITMGFRRRDTWKHMIPMGLLGSFLATLLWIAGFKYETPGRAAIYNQMSTVFIILLAWLILKEKMTPRKLAGVALAIAGALLVAWAG